MTSYAQPATSLVTLVWPAGPRFIEEKVVELHIVERASNNTIGRTQNILKPHRKQQWVIPPDAFVADMAGGLPPGPARYRP
jgi:hypothetical protein